MPTTLSSRPYAARLSSTRVEQIRRSRHGHILLGLQIGPWLTLGLVDARDVNGLPATTLLLAGVTWTLRYEWLFYLSLPLLAVAAGHRRLTLPLTAVATAAALFWAYRGGPFLVSPADPVAAALFSLGMCSATLYGRGWTVTLNDTLASCALAVLAVVLFLGYPFAFQPATLVLWALCFHLIASGCTIFGLLTCRAARRLGDASYGIYLLQGLVLACVFYSEPARRFALASPLHHWVLLLAAMVVLVCVATLTLPGWSTPASCWDDGSPPGHQRGEGR